MPKEKDKTLKWYVVDATDLALGRLASRVASVLRGKHRADYTPNVDLGDHVIIVNCEKVRLTGKKLEDKVYKRYTGYPSGLKETKYDKLMVEKPDFAVYHAVKGMLPHNALGRKLLRKLRVYVGTEHEQQAQQPEVLTLNTEVTR
jgi:large subunit ribosomal protein L13